MEPPSHEEYFLSRGAAILTFVEGIMAFNSFCILSTMPGINAVPPERTMFSKRSFLMSVSHFMMELKVILWIPTSSIPKKDGWKRTSGHLNLSLPIGIMTQPGHLYALSIEYAGLS